MATARGLLGRTDQTHHRMDPKTVDSRLPATFVLFLAPCSLFTCLQTAFICMGAGEEKRGRGGGGGGGRRVGGGGGFWVLVVFVFVGLIGQSTRLPFDLLAGFRVLGFRVWGPLAGLGTCLLGNGQVMFSFIRYNLVSMPCCCLVYTCTCVLSSCRTRL